MKQFAKIFKMYDKDKSGTLDLSELSAILDTIGVHKTQQQIEAAADGGAGLTPAQFTDLLSAKPPGWEAPRPKPEPEPQVQAPSAHATAAVGGREAAAGPSLDGLEPQPYKLEDDMDRMEGLGWQAPLAPSHPLRARLALLHPLRARLALLHRTHAVLAAWIAASESTS